jgi:protein involved in polysaccharide export with SLBB domain
MVKGMENTMNHLLFRSRIRIISAISVIVFVFSLGLYAQEPAAKNPENQRDEPALSENTGTAMTAGVSDAVLQFRTGDAVRVIVYPDSMGFPGGTYPIDSHGFVDLPIIGYLKVIDMSPHQIEQLLTEKYSAYLPRPNIAVRPAYRISLLGGFLRPGLYWVNPRESLWDAVEKAGGTQREDGIRKIKWERDTKIIKKTIIPEFQSGASLYSIGFKSGDQLRVTARPRQQFMESIQTNILPFFTIMLTTASVYATYQYYTR